MMESKEKLNLDLWSGEEGNVNLSIALDTFYIVVFNGEFKIDI
jgi:hypothetical protein